MKGGTRIELVKTNLQKHELLRSAYRSAFILDGEDFIEKFEDGHIVDSNYVGY